MREGQAVRMVRDDSALGAVVLIVVTFLCVLGALSFGWGLAQLWFGLVR